VERPSRVSGQVIKNKGAANAPLHLNEEGDKEKASFGRTKSRKYRGNSRSDSSEASLKKQLGISPPYLSVDGGNKGHTLHFVMKPTRE